MMDPEIIYASNLMFVDLFMNEKKYYNALDVLKGLEKIIDENLRGLSRISIDVPDDATVFISMKSFAMLLNEIFSFVHGKALLKLDFYSEGSKICMYITSEPEVECSFGEATRFLRFARDVGFEVSEREGKTVFSIDSRQKAIYKIYAPTAKDDVSQLAKIFESVFYAADSFLHNI